MQIHPRKALACVKFARRREFGRALECSNIIMCLGGKAIVAARECRAAFFAKAALNAGRRVEFGDDAFGNRDRIVLKRCKDTCGRATVPATALAVAPTHPFGLAFRLETNRAAET